MTLWQRIRWCIEAVEPVPESDCKGADLWLVAVVIAACAIVMASGDATALSPSGTSLQAVSSVPVSIALAGDE